MNDKLNRIERFIESLPNDVETPEATSVLLPMAMDMNGAGTNGEKCVNIDVESCKTAINHSECTNALDKCSGASNGKICNNNCGLTTNKSNC